MGNFRVSECYPRQRFRVPRRTAGQQGVAYSLKGLPAGKVCELGSTGHVSCCVDMPNAGAELVIHRDAIWGPANSGLIEA